MIGLRVSSFMNNKEMVELMINKNAKDFNIGLCYACRNETPNFQVIEILVKKGASPKFVDKYGFTSLQYLHSRKRKNLQIINFLEKKLLHTFKFKK